MNQLLRNTYTIFIVLCAFGNTFGQRYTGSISGFVRDASNGEPLGYVNIVIMDTQMGASSNDKGYYVISRVPTGNYSVFASMIGFKKITQTVRIATGQSLILDFELERDVVEMEQVVVTGERARFEQEVEISSVTLNTRDLQLSPSLVEPDLFRTLHLMPGVVAKGDFSSELYVRGGSPDQNLILLDGITVYNPFHLGGIFSTFSVDAIKEAELIAGGFPAEFGGRMSSVLDVTLLEGNSKEYEGSGSISLLTSKMTVQGPVPKGSFLMSGRRTYFDKVYELYQKQRGKDGRFPYYFYDLQGKLNLDLAEKHQLTLSGFFGNDVLKFDFDESSEDDSSGSIAGDIDWHWGNRTTSAKWTYLISPRLFSEVLLAQSKFNFEIDLGFEFTDEEGEVSDINYRVLDNINDVTLKQNITYFATPEHTIKFGHELKRILFDVELEVENIHIDLLGDSTYTYSIFGQDKWKISDILFIQPGVRATYYSEGERYRFEPRLGTKWRVKPDLAIKAAWGYYYQFLT
ncbi:MAG: TonB-dependent receptor, partial [Candidatus Marinimicrobia bacterium]|nr:TonB-dependent receptor [Candidatus Neomarinimicrobiota bacterium]